MTVDIICPIYKGEKYIENLQKNIEKQENVDIQNIRYILKNKIKSYIIKYVKQTKEGS